MFKIFQSILDKENTSEIKKYIIYPDDKGYVMYEEYRIKVTKSGDYLVEKLHTYTTKTFKTLRNAVMWATFDKSNKIMYSRKIEELDILLASTEAHIQLQLKLLKTKKTTDSISLVYTKLNEETYKKSNIMQELDDFASISSNLQNQNFNKLTK